MMDTEILDLGEHQQYGLFISVQDQPVNVHRCLFPPLYSDDFCQINYLNHSLC